MIKSVLRVDRDIKETSEPEIMAAHPGNGCLSITASSIIMRMMMMMMMMIMMIALYGRTQVDR